MTEATIQGYITEAGVTGVTGDAQPTFRPAWGVSANGKPADYIVNEKGRVMLTNGQELVGNSVLTRREWDALDRAVATHPRVAQNALQDLLNAGLVSQLPNAGILMSSFRVGSERKIADAFMDGEAAFNNDRQDRKYASVPVPIVGVATSIGWRELLASQTGGAPIDTYETVEAARAVAEKLEHMVFNGDSGISVAGNSISGYLNHASRYTETAGNLGGGDFATSGNAYKTILGMLAAMAALRYRGPFGIYLNPTQYHQLMTLNTNTDATDMDNIMRVLGPGGANKIAFIRENDFVTAAAMIAVQLSSSVVDVAMAQPIQSREWQTPNGRGYRGEVSAIMVPRLKVDFSGYLGVAHVTGC